MSKRVVYSVRDLCWSCLHTNPDVVKSLADNAVRLYRPFTKRVGSKSRLIDNPVERLKVVQGRINRNLLQTVTVADHLHGAVPGKSPLTNAWQHVGASCVVRLDIRDFFPAVTNRQVYRVWLQQVGVGPGLASLLTALTTYRGRLPLGAPTSSALANLVLSEADEEIRELAVSKGLGFTRFVDDLVFSGDDPRSLINRVVLVLRHAGFAVSHRKLKIMGPARRKVVTGLCVEGRVNRPGFPGDLVS